MPNSSDIDNALHAKLGADTTLLALMTNGVHFDEAPQGFTKFVVVSLVDEHDEPMFNGRAFEDATYLVKAVSQNSNGADVNTAAARIDTLLNNGTLTVNGYNVVAMRREARVRYTEVDEVNPSLRWQHRGGRYRLLVSPS